MIIYEYIICRSADLHPIGYHLYTTYKTVGMALLEIVCVPIADELKFIKSGDGKHTMFAKILKYKE